MYIEKRRKYGTKPWCILSVRDQRKKEDSIKRMEQSMARTMWHHRVKIRKRSKEKDVI